MCEKPFILHWGIIGSGNIASEFAKDLCLHPHARQVSDVSHAIAAVGARDIDRAQEFIQQWCPVGGPAQQSGDVAYLPKAYGSYDGVVHDSNVMAIYIATTHIVHYEHALLVLQAGKHCMIEKPATLNAAEWNSLTRIASQNKLFLMEASWTRFNPVMLAIQKILHVDEAIGQLRSLYVDCSCIAFGSKPDNHRQLAAEQAGGALLDLGPYPMLWAMAILHRAPGNRLKAPAQLGSIMVLHPNTGVDIATSFSLAFPDLPAIAHCTTNLFSRSEEQSVRITGTQGELIVRGCAWKPETFLLKRWDALSQKETGSSVDKFEGLGLYWEADAVARCVRDGLLECPLMSQRETRITMEIFDEIRARGGYSLLPGLEKIL